MVETLITASPAFLMALTPFEQKEYFNHALNFMEAKVGKENIISAVVHMDEKTPHMHLSFCPITKEKAVSESDIRQSGAVVALADGIPRRYVSALACVRARHIRANNQAPAYTCVAV